MSHGLDAETVYAMADTRSYIENLIDFQSQDYEPLELMNEESIKYLENFQNSLEVLIEGRNVLISEDG